MSENVILQKILDLQKAINDMFDNLLNTLYPPRISEVLIEPEPEPEVETESEAESEAEVEPKLDEGVVESR